MDTFTLKASTPEILLTGDTAKEGAYTINYSIENSFGEKAVAERIVIVKAKQRRAILL